MLNESWLTLSLAPDIGPAVMQQLLNHFGNVEKIVSASRAELLQTGLPPDSVTALKSPNDSRLRAALDWLQSGSHNLIHWQDEHYPPLLKETGHSPPVLFVDGNPELLCMPQIAIVGSRNATAGGRETALEFAAHLAKAGLTITSGLAAGIDAAAHEGAIHGGGNTIAVLGTGPDIVYPRQHNSLADQVRCHGALVSEFPPGMPARRDHFPRRNRIISGLSLGTLVVEAGMNSGSLITARLSADYGREVFAIPGSIHSPLSKGCHRLIKQGAKLIENSTDIIEELKSLISTLEAPPVTRATTPEAKPASDPDYVRLLSSMGFEPVNIQTLAGRSGLTTAELSSMLLILELEGRVESLPGGRFQQLTGWKKEHE
jgi:DNA processing protein